MCKNNIIKVLLVLGLGISTVFLGCNSDSVEDGKKKIENATENLDSDIKDGIDKIGNGGDTLWDKVKDLSMKYNEDDFEKAMKEKGYKLLEIDDTKSLLSVDNDDYTLNGDRISVYEYDEAAENTIEGDIKSIADNGTVINGNKTKWNSTPHIYKKGRILVIYDGNNESVLTALKEILGEPIL